MSNYSTNLTEKQWQVIKNIVDPQERSRKHFLREILNAYFMSTKVDANGEYFPLTLLLGKPSITISVNGN